MISLKQWVALLLFYLFYLLGGALVFLYLESDNEVTNLVETHNLQKRLSMNLYFIENEPIKDEIVSTIQHLESSIGKNLLLSESFQEELILNIIPIEEISTDPPSNVTNSTDLLKEIIPQFNNESSSLTDLKDKLLSPHPMDVAIINGNVKWTIWNAFFFSFTVITTIGFGHMSPSTEAGQAFCIIYSLLGVPLNGIVFAGLADIFASKIILRIEQGHYTKRRSLFFDSILYLVPGLLILLLLPAVLFMYVEDWTFLVSFYFAFITLTTIGFGDYVAGQSSEEVLVWMWPYRICIMIWIIFGLGYLLMVVAFMQRALRSKEVRILDRKMRQTFKEKMGSVQNNVSRDINRMRSVLDGIAKLTKFERRATSNDNIYNEGFEGDEDYDNAGYMGDEAKNKGKINVDMFLQLAETILQQSENDLEARVNEYNRTLTSLNELYIDENENAFRANLFPARDSIPNKKTNVRRSSIWTSNAPLSLFVEKKTDSEGIESNPNDLSQLIQRLNQMVETGIEEPNKNFMGVPDVESNRRHSNAEVEENARSRLKVDHEKRRKTVAELHIENEKL